MRFSCLFLFFNYKDDVTGSGTPVIVPQSFTWLILVNKYEDMSEM